mmetsp:Transcript_11475/g.17394  ORF Transcript_11475/g.17394 Transcript_11475/m.17394 type:complete len:258 (+) Transcript_11475:80-853(+)
MKINFLNFGACTFILAMVSVLVGVFWDRDKQTAMCSRTRPCYNLFVVQWKPEVCYDNAAPSCLDPATPNITIHGIWQNFYGGGWALNCPSDVTLQIVDIAHIEHVLRMVWPTLEENKFKTDFQFWEHEWTKHGTCWQNVVNVTQYFETALSWYDTDDIGRILNDARIVPSNEKMYLLEEVSRALETGLGCRVVPRCWTNTSRIQEFMICRDWLGENRIDCPDTDTTECDERVVLSEQVYHDPVETVSETCVVSTNIH